MKKIVLLNLIFILSITLYSQKIQNKIVYDSVAKQKILINEVDRKAFKHKSFKKWFNSNYSSYNVNLDLASEIRNLMPANLEILIIMGTWCSDSRREVPRFLKIVDIAGLPEPKIYCVNRKLKSDIDISKYNIKYVPTIIFFVNKNEIGRIIETPKKSLEEDILEIFENH